MEQFDISGHVAALVKEANTLRQQDAAQKEEIENLQSQLKYYNEETKALNLARIQYEAALDKRDAEVFELGISVENWKTDCQLFKDELAKARADFQLLTVKHASVKEEHSSLDAKLSRREQQIKNMATIMRRKIATNRVVLVAFKAAYKILPSLKEKNHYSRILELAKQAPHRDRVEWELAEALKEAGFSFAQVEPDVASQIPDEIEEPTASDADKDVDTKHSFPEAAN
ncbi:hypothetical protein FHETE_4422 [Fusarium heterosporum]|uniref:Uncharacterized protein n=1 Tax=Fusarium heterosporum TaxID=42747 RepID=A0A8H5TJJ8_FUSHE|nr:hypothetical protein FHETE_4422 [Fusarium heterosporum]